MEELALHQQLSILDLLDLERVEEDLYRCCVVVERPWEDQPGWRPPGSGSGAR
jgi:hypothetical protein